MREPHRVASWVNRTNHLPRVKGCASSWFMVHIFILDPQSTRRSRSALVPEKATRKARNVKMYKNPHNGEVVETKGGNHKLLKQWKSEYGRDEVESWLA